MDGVFGTVLVDDEDDGGITKGRNSRGEEGIQEEEEDVEEEGTIMSSTPIG